jgi:hypothetical protein
MHTGFQLDAGGTVSKLCRNNIQFELIELPMERRQIPQVVVNVRMRRKGMEFPEWTLVPYKQRRDSEIAFS